MSPDDFIKITNLLDIPVFLVNSRGVIHAANIVAHKMFSAATDELVGSVISDLVVDAGAKVKKYITSCSGSKQLVLGSLQFKAVDGDENDFRCYGALLEPACGESPALIFLRCVPREQAVGNFLLVNRKIEELNQKIRQHVAAKEALRESQAVLDGIISNATASIYMKDLQGRYLLANQHYTNLFGLQPKDFGNKTDFDLFPKEIAIKLAENDRHVYETAAPQHWEESLPLAGGAHEYISVKFPILDKNNQIHAIGCVSTDITERKNAEAKVRQLNDELEQRIQDRTKELQLSNKELGRSNKELESYSYTIAHDLRAPLRTIVSFGQLIHEAVLEKLDANDVKDFERILAAGKRMAKLVEDMLGFSRISRQQLCRDNFSFTELANDVVKSLCDAYPERSADWKIKMNINVKGDKSLLGIVLDNLLGNAFKYSSTQDNSIIEFNVTKKKGEIVYYVKDNGVGFDMNYSNKLFDPFQRLHGAEFEGTGIGLATVHRIIERHHGQIWAEAQPENGATFYFTLPTEF